MGLRPKQGDCTVAAGKCQENCAVPNFLITSHTKKEEGGKIPAVLGSGVTVTRHALDVEFGVRIPAPQHNKKPGMKILGFLILKSHDIGERPSDHHSAEIGTDQTQDDQAQA